MFPLASNSAVQSNPSPFIHSESCAPDGKTVATEMRSLRSSSAVLPEGDGLGYFPPELLELILQHVSRSLDFVNAAEAFAAAPAHYREGVVAKFSEQWQQRWFDAAKEGDVKTLAFFLSNVAPCNVNAKDRDNDTALMIAARKGDVACAKLLLESGEIDVNAISHTHYIGRSIVDRRYPLTSAVRNGHQRIVDLLLERSDILVNVKNAYGQTPLYFALSRDNPGIAEALLAHPETDIKAVGKHGATLLMVAAANGHAGIVEKWLAEGQFDVNARTTMQTTVLMFVARAGDVGIAKALLKQKDIDIHLKDMHGMTALDYAIEGRHHDMRKLLEKMP